MSEEFNNHEQMITLCIGSIGFIKHPQFSASQSGQSGICICGFAAMVGELNNMAVLNKQ